MSGLDIPEGTKIGKVMRGGKETLPNIMNILNEKAIDGYIIARLERDGDDITSYLIFKDSKPMIGIREVATRDKKYPKRRIRKVYAGENTLNEVKEDLHHEKAMVELHSDVDVETILNKYSKDKKKSKTDKTAETQAKDARRLGLFWGGKEEKENLEREALQEKLKNWKENGYDVSSLEEILSGDLSVVKTAFEKYEENVTTLEEMSAELEFFTLAGFEEEVERIKAKLKNPNQIPNIQAEIEFLEEKASKSKISGEKRICLVCGFPLGEEEKCPRCGAIAQKKGEEVEEDKEIGLLGGHCYLIEEEKLKSSIILFRKMLKKGYKGFCITRTNPKHMKSIKELEGISIIWLTDKESAEETTIPPILERIIYEIGNFLKKEEKGCLILDGIEYLISNNNFDAVLRFIRHLIDDVSESKSVFMLTVGPHTLKEQELKILEREMEKISYDDA
ncbi:MAG: DUF835 domain-containing protein [Thermoplasmata archaeon]|nr:MAG: DUF835 domain-containing protein [Thermoplasmata archaeon]